MFIVLVCLCHWLRRVFFVSPVTLFLQTCMRLFCSSVVGGVNCRHFVSCSSSTLSFLCYMIVFELGLRMLLGVVAIVFDVSLSFA